MSRPLIVNETAAGDLRGKGKMRTAVFAHSLRRDNVKEQLDPFIRSSPTGQDHGDGWKTPSTAAPRPSAGRTPVQTPQMEAAAEELHCCPSAVLG